MLHEASGNASRKTHNSRSQHSHSHLSQMTTTVILSEMGIALRATRMSRRTPRLRLSALALPGILTALV